MGKGLGTSVAYVSPHFAKENSSFEVFWSFYEESTSQPEC